MCVYVCVWMSVCGVCVCVCPYVRLSQAWLRFTPAPPHSSQAAPRLSWSCRQSLAREPRCSLLWSYMNHWCPSGRLSRAQSGEKHSSPIFSFPQETMPQFLLVLPVQTPFMGLSDSEVSRWLQHQPQIQQHPFPSPGDIGHAVPQAPSAHSPLCQWGCQLPHSKHPLGEPEADLPFLQTHSNLSGFPGPRRVAGAAPAHPPSQGGERKALSPHTSCHASVPLPSSPGVLLTQTWPWHEGRGTRTLCPAMASCCPSYHIRKILSQHPCSSSWPPHWHSPAGILNSPLAKFALVHLFHSFNHFILSIYWRGVTVKQWWTRQIYDAVAPLVEFTVKDGQLNKNKQTWEK